MAYKVIHETFWTDPRVKRLPFKLKAFFSFLITGPSAHYSGLYYLPKAYISEHTGLSKKEVAISLKTLVDAGFIQYDEATECIWVVNMLRHQMKAWGGNRRKTEIGIQKHLALLHNSILIPLFIERYSILNLTLPLTLPEPSAKVPYTDTVTVNNISLEGGMGGVEAFIKFWQVYPRKEGKANALKAWKKLRVDNGLFQTIYQSLQLQRASPQWSKDGGKYIPHASTWLNGRRWEDELSTNQDDPLEGIKQWKKEYGGET